MWGVKKQQSAIEMDIIEPSSMHRLVTIATKRCVAYVYNFREPRVSTAMSLNLVPFSLQSTSPERIGLHHNMGDASRLSPYAVRPSVC
jgi:hypothetical protein